MAEAHPDIVHWFGVIKAKFPDCHVSWTFRSKEWQDKAVFEGKSKLKWPNSYHNHMENGKPCSRAMDLFQLHPEYIALFPKHYFRKIWDFIVDQKIPLGWGGEWGWDADHFQMHVKK